MGENFLKIMTQWCNLFITQIVFPKHGVVALQLMVQCHSGTNGMEEII